MSKEETKYYFERAIIKYSKGDIQDLIGREINSAGPFLMVILNGIDNLGGMCYGFELGSKDRSIKFMEEKMGISNSLASLLYKVVRCGITHQGMPKIGLRYFVDYDCTEKDIFYRDAEEYLYLNVMGFTNLYIKTIELISCDIEKHISYVPTADMEAKNIFDRASREIGKDINNLAIEIGYMRKSKKPPESSDSAYTPENILNIKIDLPKES